MKVGFVITGRMKSTRLPFKLSLEILEEPIISWMVKRAKLVFENDEIVIATSTNPQDDYLEQISEKEGVKIFRGDEEDVVLRLYEAAKLNKFDYIINITADCPLFGFDYIQQFKQIIESETPDLLTCLDLPHGIFVYVIKTKAFEKVIEIKKTKNTEVWGVYFYENPELFKIRKLEFDEQMYRPGFRLTIDYKEDFDFFVKIFEHFGKETYTKTSKEIVGFLDRNPEVVGINKDCKQKYQERWESQQATKLEKE